MYIFKAKHVKCEYLQYRKSFYLWNDKEKNNSLKEK